MYGRYRQAVGFSQEIEKKWAEFAQGLPADLDNLTQDHAAMKEVYCNLLTMEDDLDVFYVMLNSGAFRK